MQAGAGVWTILRRDVIATLSLAAAVLGCGEVTLAQGRNEIPHLRRQGSATQLIVDGVPYIVLGGELGNSTASGVAGVEPVWPRLKALHLNTVIAPVYWELIESSEGTFVFASVDSLVDAARRNGMHLVLLWFGS